MLGQQQADARPGPVLQIVMLSHGTLECRNLDKTRDFYERFLGLEVVRTSKNSMWIRLNCSFAIACVQTGEKKSPMPLLNHNGLDVTTREDVDRAYATIVEQRETWGIGRVTKPVDQHGTYSFYFLDLDENWWEILTNPPGGYSWMFKGQGDVTDWGAGEVNTNPNAFGKKNAKP
jgi:catechol 2,3-dioxygenase-like lactoylglutathione lyase family enzyme